MTAAGSSEFGRGLFFGIGFNFQYGMPAHWFGRGDFVMTYPIWVSSNLSPPSLFHFSLRLRVLDRIPLGHWVYGVNHGVPPVGFGRLGAECKISHMHTVAQEDPTRLEGLQRKKEGDPIGGPKARKYTVCFVARAVKVPFPKRTHIIYVQGIYTPGCRGPSSPGPVVRVLETEALGLRPPFPVHRLPYGAPWSQ